MRHKQPEGGGQRADRKSDRPRTRDGRGRWLPGHCPNPSGRPRNKTLREQLRQYGGIKAFGDEIIEVVHEGKKTYMDRRSALHCKLFESAMKGSVYAQRFLKNEFTKNDEQMAEVRVRYEYLFVQWLEAVKKAGGENEIDFPLDLEIDLMKAESLFSHYSGGTTPTLVTDQYKIRQEGKKWSRKQARKPDDPLS